MYYSALLLLYRLHLIHALIRFYLILLTFGHGEFIANDNNLWSDLFQNEKYMFMWPNTKEMWTIKDKTYRFEIE